MSLGSEQTVGVMIPTASARSPVGPKDGHPSSGVCLLTDLLSEVPFATGVMKNGGSITGDVMSVSPSSARKKLRYHLDRSVRAILHVAQRQKKRAQRSLESGSGYIQKPWIYTSSGNHHADVTYTSSCHQFDVFEFTGHHNQHWRTIRIA